MLEGEVTNEKSLVRPTFDMEVEVKIPKDMPKVEHNLDKLESYAEQLKEFYGSLIIEEKDVKDAEAEVTKLNKLIDKVKRLRIDSINDYKKPIDDFESTAKKIEALLNNTKDSIKSVLDVYDAKRIDKKYNEVIKPILDSLVSDAFCKGFLIDTNRIEQSKRWYNKTIKDEDIENDIQSQINEMIIEQQKEKEGIEIINKTISMTNNDKLNTDMYIERFKYTKDLTSVLNDIERENNVSHETSKEQPKDDIWNTQDKMIVSFSGNAEQIEKLKAYAKELGMEEIYYADSKNNN